MKLKKIASLALAGVMAVSMLAGCAGKTGTTDEGTKVEDSTPAIVAAANNGQSADNDVKITFTDAGDLMTTLQKAVDISGSGSISNLAGNKNTLLSNIVKLTGVGGTISNTSVVTVNPWSALSEYTKGSDGEKKSLTAIELDVYDAANYFNTESYVLVKAAKDLDAKMAALKPDSSADKVAGDTYYKYDYTGKVGMLTYKTVDGHTYYVVLTAVTRTATEAEMPEY